MSSNNSSYYIRIHHPESLTRTEPLDIGENIIGRTPECSIAIECIHVSRKHCMLTVQHDGSVVICDLESRNGTFVNEEAILPEEQRELLPGDRIRVAKTTLRLLEG